MSRAIGIGHGAGELPPTPSLTAGTMMLDDETLTAFRAYLADELGEDAVTLLDRRLDGVSLRQLARDPAFSGTTAWALRRLMRALRDAALEFARRQGDDEFLARHRAADGRLMSWPGRVRGWSPLKRRERKGEESQPWQESRSDFSASRFRWMALCCPASSTCGYRWRGHQRRAGRAARRLPTTLPERGLGRLEGHVAANRTYCLGGGTRTRI